MPFPAPGQPRFSASSRGKRNEPTARLDTLSDKFECSTLRNAGSVSHQRDRRIPRKRFGLPEPLIVILIKSLLLRLYMQSQRARPDIISLESSRLHGARSVMGRILADARLLPDSRRFSRPLVPDPSRRAWPSSADHSPRHSFPLLPRWGRDRLEGGGTGWIRG